MTKLNADCTQITLHYKFGTIQPLEFLACSEVRKIETVLDWTQSMNTSIAVNRKVGLNSGPTVAIKS